MPKGRVDMDTWRNRVFWKALRPGKDPAPDPARQTSDIWIYDVARNLKTHFTFDPADELALTWSPDGKRVVFNSSRKGLLDLYQKAADRSGTEALLLEDNLGKWPASWSPDGSSIYYFILGDSFHSSARDNSRVEHNVRCQSS